MDTKILHINPRQIDQDKLNIAARLIREGELVAFPTETVYGLGANALSSEAVGKIFEAKGRPTDNPLIVHIADPDMLEPLIRFMPEHAEEVMERFWPGPLTLIFPKSDDVPDQVTAGLDTVAIRMPSNPIAHALIYRAGVPIAAPSANLSGKPSPTRIKDVIEDMDGRIACIIDGGDCEVGIESTVLDLNSDQHPTILRPGGVSKEDLEELLGGVQVHSDSVSRPASPGMKYRHYAPRARVILIEGDAKKSMKTLKSRIAQEKALGRRVGALVYGDEKGIEADAVMSLGETSDDAGKSLFAHLREMDRKGIDTIIVEGVEEKGSGLAIMNRLKKAASETVQAD